MSIFVPSDFRAPFFRNQWIRVKNGSGVTIPPFSVVYPSNAVVDSNCLLVTVSKPNSASTDFYRHYMVTGPEAIDSTSTAEGLATSLEGYGYVSYDTGTPTLRAVWGPKNGQFTISEHYFGFEILGSLTTFNGVGVVSARQIGVHTVIGKIDDSSISKGGSCTVSVYAGSGGSEADTGMNITGVYNRWINMTSTTGKWCWVGWNADVPYLISVECS